VITTISTHIQDITYQIYAKIHRSDVNHPIPSSWRWIALASWVLLALAFLALFLIDLRLDYLQLLKPCQGADCNWMAITPAEVDVLASWGLSTRAYAAFMTGTAILTVAIYWLLGGLILVRLGTTRIGLAISLVFLAIPIALISDPDNLYTTFRLCCSLRYFSNRLELSSCSCSCTSSQMDAFTPLGFYTPGCLRRDRLHQSYLRS